MLQGQHPNQLSQIDVYNYMLMLYIYIYNNNILNECVFKQQQQKRQQNPKTNKTNKTLS